jgi:oligopeptide/dipeptide ABC transporter ATP-binding protein
VSAILEVEGLCKHYGHGRRSVRAVEDVWLTVGVGETLALVGESGSGKTTVARSIVRLVEPSSGRAWWHPRTGPEVDLFRLRTQEMRKVRREVQLVFQDPWSSLNPRVTAAGAIAEVLRVHRLAESSELEDRVVELLRRVGLGPEHGERYPHALSGGQRQRVAIARAIAVRPRMLVCDEPLAALDVSIQAQILNLLSDLRDELDLSLLLVSHDLAVVRHLADRVAVMLHGRIVEEGPVAEVFAEPRHPYTRLLLSCIPDPFRARTGGEPPQALDGAALEFPEAGCVFRPRCPIAETRCATERPLLLKSGGTRLAACHVVARDERGQNSTSGTP